MVVHFALDAPVDSVSSSATDERHPVKKKYLVGRSREKKNSIFDYVHLSSSLLRKIRYGQSLDAVLEARSPWGSDECSTLQAPPSVFRTKAPPSVPRIASTPSSRLREKSLNQHVHTALPAEGTIQYGRTIQLQATDGGFLAVDDDGSLFKLPKTQRGDSRTLLTLFPQDPLRAPLRKARVATGEFCFLVQGAATIGAHHEVLYADSREIIEPPAALRSAVQNHCREHGGGGSRSRAEALPVGRTGSPSVIWSFQSMPERDAHGEVLETGTMVQLTQGTRTLHYEMEPIVKRKYKPISSGGPETAESTELEAPISPATASTPGNSVDAGDGQRETKPPPFTHVWLQQNDFPAQHDTARLSKGSGSAARHKRWDNLWFIIDVATDRRLERERKKRLAVLEAEEEAQAERDDEWDDSDDESLVQRRPSRGQNLATVTESDNAPSVLQKRVSAMNAHVFVSQTASDAQNRAASIIVRFLRRIYRREAERRAKVLIERKIRRTGKHARAESEGRDVQLSTTQQLRVLQCFKPAVYGSQQLDVATASPSRHPPGISLQGSKFPAREATRLASMKRDLLYLGTSDFQQQQTNLHRHPNQDLRPDLLKPLLSNLRTKHHEQISRERERGQKLHVQLAMAHREMPSFHFGKHALSIPHHLHHQRPHTAPGSPSSKS